MKTVRLSEARKVLRRIFEKFGPGASLRFEDKRYVIAWEGGPFQWTYACIDLTDDMEVWTEPVNSYELAIYPR
jgi:hypothetical protein